MKKANKASTTTTENPSENYEKHQLEIDFEDEIQDFVYLVPEKNQRWKRQVIYFPDVDEIKLDKVNRKLADVEDIKTTKTTFEFRNLKHFTQYMISIRACRKETKEEIDETRENYRSNESKTDERCGASVVTHTWTLMNYDTDTIPKFNVEKIGNNSVRISWKAPKSPNGIVVSYLIKMESLSKGKTETICVQAVDQQKLYEFVKDLSPGNWKFSVAAVSFAGKGNFTKPIGTFL